MEGGVEGMSLDSLVTLLSREEAGQKPTLVVDCRPFMAFNAGHVVQAVNVHIPPILKRRSGGLLALENIVVEGEQRERLLRGEYGRVVVYDQSTEHLPPSSASSAVDGGESNLPSVLRSLRQLVPQQEVLYLQGGYDAFCHDCPLMCVTQQFSPLMTGRAEATQSQAAAERDDDRQPVEILPHLFLGSGEHSSQREGLQGLGVTALVNVSAGCPDHFPAHFRYLRIPVQDNASEDLASWFPLANQFIDEVKAEGGRVLVHCQAGRSRSATVCLAYLIRTLDLSLDAAFEHVRARRQVIDPNLNFMRQLQDYRQRLDRERSSHTAAAARGSSLPPSVPSGLSSQSSDSLSRPSGAAVSTSSGSSVSSGSSASAPSSLSLSLSCAMRSLSWAPAEGLAPVTTPSSPPTVVGRPAVFSTADPPHPPSPATASDVHCFFVFPSDDFPSSEFFPSSSLARTPEILLPS